MADTKRKNPGDEDVPGGKQTGVAPCSICNGSGEVAGKPCIDCGGSGLVTAILGDA